MEVDKENTLNIQTPLRQAPLKARKTPKHQLASSVAALSAPSPTKLQPGSPRRVNSVPIAMAGKTSAEFHESPVRNRKRRRPVTQEEEVPEVQDTIVAGPLFAEEPAVDAAKPQKKRRKIEDVVQPLVHKLLERTSSLGQFVKNTPLKFGNRKKQHSMRFTVANNAPSIPEAEGEEEAMDVEEKPQFPSQPLLSLPMGPGDFGLSSFSDPYIRPMADATPRRVSQSRSRTKALKHSLSLAQLPTQKRGLTLVKPPVDARAYKPMIEAQPGWILELGAPDAAPFAADLALPRGAAAPLEAQSERWYSDYFAGKDHQNFVAVDEKVGVVSVSLKKEDDMVRALVRTSSGENKINIAAQQLKSPNIFRSNSAKQMLKALDTGLNLKQIREVKEIKHEDELKLFEKNETHTQYKWGVLYCGQGQQNENEMWHNKSGSEAFQEFLSILGDRVTLQGFKGYNGGLDTNKNTTGSHSIYTRFNGLEIMYHVSTMLPYTQGCEQQLERKRHLGNDIVVIVFQDGLGDTYIPDTIRTHFQHILVVVQAEKPARGPTRFRVQFARKEGVPVYGPQLPAPATFESGDGFRHFLLTKLLNAEKAALKAPAFEKAISRTRSGFLQLYGQQYQSH